MADRDRVADRWRWAQHQEDSSSSAASVPPRRSMLWKPVVMGVSPPPIAEPDQGQSDAGRDQRQSDRYDVRCAVRLSKHEADFAASMINLSLGGARLRMEGNHGLALGDRVRVTFTIPTATQALSADAEVRWVAPPRSMVGVQFVTGFRAKETWALGRFLEQLRRVS